MTKPRHRSRSMKRVTKTTPIGRSVLHHKAVKLSKKSCVNCGAVLKGVSHGTSTEIRQNTKTHRQPERPKAGLLCSRCMRIEIINKAAEMVMKDG